MKTLVLLAFTTLGLAYPSAYNLPDEWTMFKFNHEKTYKNQFEEQFRMNIYLNNKRKIEEHNAKYEEGKISFKMKMNHFGDLMAHEFSLIMNGFNKTRNCARKAGLKFNQPTNVHLPISIDWRTEGAVTPVKNQGECGSCWAFSTTGALEGQIFRKTGKLVSLSEQNLIDCSTKYGNNGCNGGLMDQAFQYIKDNQGVDTEESYPYEGIDNECRFSPNNIGGTDSGYVDIPQNNEDALKTAIATFGPIAVAIDAGHDSFQFYAEGVYDEPKCSSYALDHGVLAVGYGSEFGHDFWLVKNSWGQGWGEGGFIKMSRNKNNQCGIASMASYPLA